jgi:hypothetical protein
MKAPLSSSSTCSSIAKKARSSPLLLALALCLLCFSFLYGEDLKELLARHAEGASRLIVNTYSTNIIQNEQSTAPPSGKVSKSLVNLKSFVITIQDHMVIRGCREDAADDEEEVEGEAGVRAERRGRGRGVRRVLGKLGA